MIYMRILNKEHFETTSNIKSWRVHSSRWWMEYLIIVTKFEKESYVK